MKKKETEMLDSLYQLTSKYEDLSYNKGILSDSTISKIVEGTQNFNLEKQTTFYKQLLKVAETAKTEQEILDKGIAIRDSLLASTPKDGI